MKQREGLQVDLVYNLSSYSVPRLQMSLYTIISFLVGLNKIDCRLRTVIRSESVCKVNLLQMSSFPNKDVVVKLYA